MNKKISLGAAITVAAMLATVVFSITMIFAQNFYNEKLKNVGLRDGVFEKLSELDRVVNQNFFGEINGDDLIDSTARGYVAGIGDPYSAYLTQEELKTLDATFTGVQVGIGAKIKQSESGYIQIIEVWKDSPAELVGLTSGDLIVKVGDIDVNSNYAGALTALTLGADEVVNITYRRGSEDVAIDITLKSIQVPTVYSKIVSGVAFIRVTAFYDNTYDQLVAAINSAINTDNVKGFIFDLRDNPGGLLTSAVSILDYLLPEGTLLTVKTVNGEETVYKSDENSLNYPIVVMANKSTSSAAELFVAALKDYKAAAIIGERTVGKGVTQKLFPLIDGSSVRLTYATFYTPNGTSFDGVGVLPDYESKMAKDIYDVWKNTPFINITADASVDPQLVDALESLQSLIMGEEIKNPSPVEEPSPEEVDPAEGEATDPETPSEEESGAAETSTEE